MASLSPGFGVHLVPLSPGQFSPSSPCPQGLLFLLLWVRKQGFPLIALGVFVLTPTVWDREVTERLMRQFGRPGGQEMERRCLLVTAWHCEVEESPPPGLFLLGLVITRPALSYNSPVCAILGTP